MSERVTEQSDREPLSLGYFRSPYALMRLGLPGKQLKIASVIYSYSNLKRRPGAQCAMSFYKLAGSAGAGLHMGAGGMGLQMPLNQRVFLAQFDAISKIASEGPCVIVGRCADYVLKDRPGITHIFVYASEERRIERIMRVEKVDREHARELIRKTDRQRRSYYNFFADGNWGMRSNYDLMIRTDGRRPEEVADAIISFARMRTDA